MRRAAPIGALLVAAAVGLTGCGSPAAPTAWQQSVQTVAEQASAGDYTSALASLDALEAEVVARRDTGEITPAEADAILARIATVRSDLTASLPAPSASPTPEQTSEFEETAEPEKTAEPAPTETTAPTPEETQNGGGAGDETPSKGNDDKGPGGGGAGGKDDKKPGDGASTGPGKKGG